MKLKLLVFSLFAVVIFVAFETYSKYSSNTPPVHTQKTTSSAIPTQSPTQKILTARIKLQKENPNMVINEKFTTLSIYDFSILYPSTWVDICDSNPKCIERTKEEVGISIDAPDGYTSIGIIPYKYNRKIEFEEYILDQIPDSMIQDFLKNFKYTSKKIGNLTYYETSSMPSGNSGCFSTFITDNHQRYVDFEYLCGYSTSENKKIYKVEYDQIISTFKFTN